MPRIMHTTVYRLSELNEKARKLSIDSFRFINVVGEWWDYIYEDAKNVGIEIKGFDIGRPGYCVVSIDNCFDTAERIVKKHGKDCNTYKAAVEFINMVNDPQNWLNKLEPCERDASSKDAVYKKYNAIVKTIEDAVKTFERQISECYLSMLMREYEYKTSDEAVVEMIEANQYEFTEEGKWV